MANKQIKALILAGGQGVRLDQIKTPKPLVRVGNKPMILWKIEQLEEAGVKDIYVAGGKWRLDLMNEFKKNGRKGANIHFLKHEDGHSIADALELAAEKISGPLFMAMSDLVLEKNPYESFGNTAAYREESIVSLIDKRKDIVERSGSRSRVMLADGAISEIQRDREDAHAGEIGVYFLAQGALSRLAKHARSQAAAESVLEAAFNAYAKEGLLFSSDYAQGEWFDVNDPVVHMRAEIFAREKHVSGPGTKQAKPLIQHKEFTAFYRDRRMHSDILIGLDLTKKLDQIKIIPDQHAHSRHILLTDDNVDKLYGDRVLKGLQDAGYDISKIVVPAGEDSKRMEVFAEVADETLARGIDKNSVIVSLGGGVINNIAGYLASTLYRGIGLIHIPTSSMAQVDAAIDFKQAINSRHGKNLIGSYHPASVIAIDPAVLTSLDERHLRNGISESIKHALTQDADFLQYMEDNADNIYDTDYLDKVVRLTIEHKVPLLNGDVEDDYNEMLPQYGHAIGHAIEHLSKYGLYHGEAIAIGMCLSAEIGRILGICDDETVETHYRVFEKYNLPTIVPEEMTAEDICNKMKYDKHYVKGNPQMAIVQKIGNVWNDDGVYGAPIEYSLILKAIEKSLERKVDKK